MVQFIQKTEVSGTPGGRGQLLGFRVLGGGVKWVGVAGIGSLWFRGFGVSAPNGSNVSVNLV